MKHQVGILGANGFIGSRIVEMFHLESLAQVRPIVRTVQGMSRSARFALDIRVADGFEHAALCNAFAGCDVIVHTIAGDRRTILGTLAPTYAAAQAVGVRRLIYLSSASVHGQAPSAGTDESSPLSTRQSVPYNNAKVLAERVLRKLRDKGTVEVVILRPGIVFGPRSSWTGGLADEILSGRAYLVDGGGGICNSTYVDNLAHAIFLALTAADVDRQAFLIADRETITWRDFYAPLAKALGMDLSWIPCPELELGSVKWKDRNHKAHFYAGIRRVVNRLPIPLAQGLRSAYAAWRRPHDLSRSPWANCTVPPPTITAERALLHRCQYKLPSTKAQALLGYEPIISFAEGCRRSVSWLAFAGYPVADN
jgi:2-alkyl-3-oxoalkanoate reductase